MAIVRTFSPACGPRFPLAREGGIHIYNPNAQENVILEFLRGLLSSLEPYAAIYLGSHMLSLHTHPFMRETNLHAKVRDEVRPWAASTPRLRSAYILRKGNAEFLLFFSTF